MDKKAKRILFKTYWYNGWIDDKNRKIDDSDFTYAKEKGLMFDTLTISFDECVEKIIKLTNEIPKDKYNKDVIDKHFGKNIN